MAYVPGAVALDAIGLVASVSRSPSGGSLELRTHDEWSNALDDTDLVEQVDSRGTREAFVALHSEARAIFFQRLAQVLYDYSEDDRYLQYIGDDSANPQGQSANAIQGNPLSIAESLRGRPLREISLEEYEALESAIEGAVDAADEVQILNLAFGNQAQRLVRDHRNIEQFKRAMALADVKFDDVSLAITRDVNHWILSAATPRKKQKFVIDPFTGRILDWKRYGEVTLEQLEVEAAKLT